MAYVEGGVDTGTFPLNSRERLSELGKPQASEHTTNGANEWLTSDDISPRFSPTFKHPPNVQVRCCT